MLTLCASCVYTLASLRQAMRPPGFSSRVEGVWFLSSCAVLDLCCVFQTPLNRPGDGKLGGT